MKLVDDWSKKRRDHHGFTTNMGTVLALDGFLMEIKNPNTFELDGQEVGIYRNRKGFWGLTSQVAFDSNAKVRIVQTDWPGATNNLSCFKETPLFLLLQSRQLPEWLHIIADEAYSPLSVECNHQILTPFSKHQLNAAKKDDWQNLQDWHDRISESPNLDVMKPTPKYWKMRAFNHELSSEQITIERVLGMIVQRFGILWRPMEYDVNKVSTTFHVLCKLNNICMDCWLPTDACLHRFSSAEAIPFSNDDYLWSTFDISVSLDDIFDLTSDEIIVHLENRFCK
jgi:hypothetical protein